MERTSSSKTAAQQATKTILLKLKCVCCVLLPERTRQPPAASLSRRRGKNSSRAWMALWRCADSAAASAVSGLESHCMLGGHCETLLLRGPVPLGAGESERLPHSYSRMLQPCSWIRTLRDSSAEAFAPAQIYPFVVRSAENKRRYNENSELEKCSGRPIGGCCCRCLSRHVNQRQQQHSSSKWGNTPALWAFSE